MSLERAFGLDARRDFVVGGEVAEVEAALEAWNVTHVRDERTGDIIHPGLAYVVDRRGTVAYLASGLTQLVSLGRLVDGQSAVPGTR
jgi:hypothetical protein